MNEQDERRRGPAPACAGRPARGARCCRSRSPAGSPRAAGRRGRTSSRCSTRSAAALDAADRADRRRQDARRLPAEPGRACAQRRDAEQGAGAAHALYLAAEGAGRRRRAQPDGADRGDGAADPHRDAHRRHPRRPAGSASASRPPDILLTTPEQLALLLEPPRLRRICSPTSTRSSSTSCMRWRRPSAATCWRSTWRGCARWRPGCMTHRPVGDGGAAARAARLSRAAARATAVIELADLVRVERRRQAATSPSSRSTSRCPGPATPRAMPCPRSTTAIKAHRLTPRVRQHAHAGGAAVPGAVAHQRGRSADRAAPRLARRRAAPQGRGGDGGRHAARRRRHLDARSRHRLGRRRPRHPRRRAEGRKPLHPAHRPRQPPPRRALAGASWCRRTASRCSNAAPRSMRPRPARRMRRCRARARSTCWPSTCCGTACAGAVRARRAL